MADAPVPEDLALDAARREAGRIAEFGDDPADVREAQVAFSGLCDIYEQHSELAGLIRIAVCGANRYMAVGRQSGNLRIIREAHLFLADLAMQVQQDPMVWRACAEASVDLMLMEAQTAGLAGALDTYRAVAAISEAHAGDPDIAGVHAKGAANLVALALDADDPKEADRALADLERLEAAQPGVLSIRQQRGRGLFNRIADAVSRSDDDPALVSTGVATLAELVTVACQQPIDPDLVDLAAEGIFAVVTGLGNRGEIELALRHYEDLSAVARLAPGRPTGRRRLADAAFNLITDLCELGDAETATLLYGELSGLSVANDGDRSICLAHAKAAANLILTHRDRKDDTAAEIISEDLRALVVSHPRDMDLIEVASFLERSDR